MKSHCRLPMLSTLVFLVFVNSISAQNVQLPQDYSLDIQLGLSARSHAMGSSVEIVGTPANEVADEVFRNLIANSGYGSQTYPWKLTLVNNSTVNASSNPGGQVYVYGGLMQIIGDNKGLWAAVLSHETAHTGQRHGVRLYLQEEYNARMIQYYRARLEAGDKSAGFALAAFQISSALLIKKMERDQEHEADQKGMLIMARAGYHPDFVFALHHLLQTSTGEQSKFGAFFSDHPRWETRDQRSDRVYGDALAEFNRVWSDSAKSPGGRPPLVAFLGKPEASEDKQAGIADLKIPLYCRNSEMSVDVAVLLQKDKHPVKALDPKFADQDGNFTFHQQAICLDKDDAPPFSIHIPATAVSRDDHSVKADIVVASSGHLLATSKSFDIHFPKEKRQSVAGRDIKRMPESNVSKASMVASAQTPVDRPVSVISPVATKPGTEDKVETAIAATREIEPAQAVSKVPIPNKVDSVKALAATPLKNESAPVTTPVVRTSFRKSGVLGVSGANWTEGGVSGVEILEVEQNSPAEIVGLHVHDVITHVNGRRVRSNADLAAALDRNGPGSTIVLRYISKNNLGWMAMDTSVVLADK